MNISDRRIKKYLRAVRSWLPCGLREKARMLSDLKNQINDYLEAHPEADFSAVEAHFGAPQQIAAAFVDEMGTAELLYKLRIRRRIIKTIAIVLASTAAIAILGILSVYVIALIDSFNASGGYLIIDQTGF